MVGTRYEREGIVKHGSKMVNAVSTSTVPQFTVIVGGSYGAGNYGMCGRAYDPRFLWTWPNSRVAVMGGEQASGVLAIVQVEQAKSRGIEPNMRQIALMQQMTRQKFDQDLHRITLPRASGMMGLLTRATLDVYSVLACPLPTTLILSGRPPQIWRISHVILEMLKGERTHDRDCPHR